MSYPTYLIHYGIQGQKWGVRRFQNEDGTWTEDGLVRRRKDQRHLVKKQERLGKKFDRYTRKMESDLAKGKKISDRRIEKANKIGAKFKTLDYISKDPDTYFKARKLRTASAVKLGVNTAASAAGIGLIMGKSNEIKDIEKALTETSECYKRALNRVYEMPNTDVQRLNFVKDYVRAHEFDDKGNIILNRGEVHVPNSVYNYLHPHPHLPIDKTFINKITGKFDRSKFDRTIGLDIDFYERTFETFKRFEINREKDFWGTRIENLGTNLDKATKTVNIAGVATALNIGRTAAEFATEQHLINKMVKNHYNDSYDKAYKSVAKDLKKHGFEKENALSEAKQQRIKALIASGKSQEEVANALGISTSTVKKYK